MKDLADFRTHALPFIQKRNMHYIAKASLSESLLSFCTVLESPYFSYRDLLWDIHHADMTLTMLAMAGRFVETMQVRKVEKDTDHALA